MCTQTSAAPNCYLDLHSSAIQPNPRPLFSGSSRIAIEVSVQARVGLFFYWTSIRTCGIIVHCFAMVERRLCFMSYRFVLCVALCATFSPIPLPAEDPGAKRIPAPTLGAQLPDTELLDQYGTRVRFLSDVVQNNTVAITFIFTTCTTICPPIGVNMARLERVLQERSAKGFRVISISVDPVTDTPERLNMWSAKFSGGSGWTLLTGSKRDVDDLLRSLAVYSPDKLTHT